MKKFFASVLIIGFAAAASTPSLAAERSNVEGWLDHGDRMYRAEKFEAAIAAYKEVHVWEAENTRALRGLIRCYEELGDDAKAAKYLVLLREIRTEAVPETVRETRSEARARKRKEALAKAVPFADKMTIDVSPELGLHDFNTNAFGLQGFADDYLDLIKALGYTQNTKAETDPGPNYLMAGVRLELIPLPFIGIGGGYRILGVGTNTLEASGEYLTPFYQYMKITETQTFSASMAYLTVGLYQKFGPRNNKRVGLRPVIGQVWGDGTSSFKLVGYNGSNFSRSGTMAFTSQATWVSLSATFDYQFLENMSLGFEAGYKRLRFDKFTITKIDSNFSTQKVGDTVKDPNGDDYSVNLDGLVALFKVSFLWQP